MKNQLQKGFTLIELLVVIVIIGILATIGVATFQGYFAKARDTERLSAVRNISTMVKTDQVVNDVADYSYANAAAINVVLAAQGYSVPATKQGVKYFYVHNGSDNFAVITCKESELGTTTTFGNMSDAVFVDGTSSGIAAFDTEAAGATEITDACATTPADLTAAASGASSTYTVIILTP